MGEYTRFRADLWTVNNNFESSACITSQTDALFVVKGTFRTESDYIGVFWNSKDIITHDLLSYPTDTDYTGVKLSFKATWSNMKSLLDNTSNLIITQVDGEEKYIPFTYFCTQQGSSYGKFTINFDDLTDVTYSVDYNGSSVEYNVQVDITQIKSIMIPVVPIGYVPAVTETVYGTPIYHFSMIENTDYQLSISQISVENGFLGYEPECNLSHNYRLAEGYDDTYNLVPRRLAYMMNRLGYTDWLDFYIGAAHYYEKGGTLGAPARSSNDIETPDYSNMTLDTSEPLNVSFTTWFDDYCKWSKYYGMDNLILSVSLENLQMPDSWKQLLHDGTPGGTGWTPSTNFFSLCNSDVRDYVQSVCEACLDIMVSHNLPAILQWGEPWWWWQECYPESISIDPENQTTNTEVYPGQPPAFYDQATKDKYYAEKGTALPVYTSSTDNYDPAVIAWLRNQLVDYSNFMRSIVKSNRYTNGLYTVLYFPPSILDTGRVPQMMQEVNYPVDAWNKGQLDFLQLEDYDWVTSDDDKHEMIWNFGQGMNYPNSKVHYFGGYNQYPKDAPHIWPLIINALEEAVSHSMSEVFVWAGTQIRRDNITLSDRSVEAPGALAISEHKEIAVPLLNIIVLNPQEQVLRWLIPDFAEIKEINEVDKVRKITLTYPLEEGIVEDSNPWFSHGNKIFVPAVHGIDNCLYIVNTSYSLDYWENNTVTIELEEVLVELNNQVVAVYEDTKITPEKLNEWFGQFYNISIVEDLDKEKNSISAIGTVTLMTLYRTIEEKTERKFHTEYTYQNNKIIRKLSLLREDTLRQTAGTEYLDLNYNLESLELEIDEDSVYSAMAPILSMQEKQGTDTSDYVNWSDSQTSTTTVTTESAEEIFQKWLDLEVKYREYIPMIRKKESDNTIRTTAWWYAPFQKQKGNLYIENINYSNSTYNHIQPPANGNKLPNPLVKMGTVSTSETDVYAIYNVLANSLLEKTSSKFTLSLKVKDISDMLGNNALGFNVYETLYVRIPGFDYYVPAYITKTTKNLHLPSDDSITVETDVHNTHLTHDTEIQSENQIISAQTSETSIGGLLLSDDGTPVSDELISINIRLVEAYDETGNPVQQVKEFKPAMETYYFADYDIWELEQNLRKNDIDGIHQREYVLRDIRGDSYSVPVEWCFCIYYTFIQRYINTDYPMGTGVFPSVVKVHYYSDNLAKLKENGNVQYYPSRFYDTIVAIRNFYHSKGIPGEWDCICSNEIQSGDTCMASAVSNLTAYFHSYYTEQQIVEMFGTDQGLKASELRTIFFPTLEKLGYEWSIVEMTQQNISDYINFGHIALLAVVTEKLGGIYADTHGAHEILLYDWYELNGEMTCYWMDSNIPVFNPGAVNNDLDPTTTNCMKVDSLIDAAYITKDSDGDLQYTRSEGVRKYMIVCNPSKRLYPSGVVNTTVPVNVSDNNTPSIVAYGFSSNEVETRWKEMCRLMDTDNNAAFGKQHEITATNNKTYKLSLEWIFCLAFEYMSYYIDYTFGKAERTVYTGSNSTAYSMYQRVKENKGLLVNAMICRPEVHQHQTRLLLSTLLFWCGALEPCSTVYNGTEFDDNSTLSLSDIAGIVESKCSGITTSVLSATSGNVSGSGGLYVCYLQNSKIESLHTRVADDYFDDNKDKQPVIIMDWNSTTIWFYSVMHLGTTLLRDGVNNYWMPRSEFFAAVTGDMLKVKY